MLKQRLRPVTLLLVLGLSSSAVIAQDIPLFNTGNYPELISLPATAEATGLPEFVGEIAEPNPLPPIFIPPNPYLDEQGKNGLHGDNYNSDVYNYPGPLGKNPQVSSRQIGAIGTCPTVVFAPSGHVVTVCIGLAQVRMFLMDPHSLEVVAEHSLPLRAAFAEGRFDELLTDSSGGGYFHMDNLGRVLVGPANQQIETWEAVEVKKKQWEWQLVSAHNLSDLLDEGVHLQDAMTDYYGRTWFTTGAGLVGYVNEVTGQTETIALDEFLQNSMVVDLGTEGTAETAGTYVVTVEALYKLKTAADGSIYIDWRQAYLNDGGQGGLLSSGSGTTPTAFGNNDDMIAIADNSAGRINLNVYMRESGDLVCSHPMFEEGASATENSPIGYGNSVVLENNAGYGGPFGDPLLVEAGLTKITVKNDYSGCVENWYNRSIKAQTTPRLSTETGLIYSYSVKAGTPIFGFIPTFGWYFTSIAWDTGEVINEVWVGSGPFWNNVLDPVTLAPDGTAYAGTLSGIMAIRDCKSFKKGKCKDK
jgi:hypothetical protein